MRVHTRHNSKQKKVIRILLVSVVILIIGLLLPRAITAVSRVVLYPVYSVHTWFLESSAVFPMYLRDRKELIAENISLKNELAVAVSTDLTQQRLFEENTWLRQLLNAESGERIAAAVVARPNELPYDLMQIDRGSDDGIVVGAPVYIGADNVIGIIAHTAPDFSFIELFTTPGFEATAFIGGADVVATVEGYGSGVARVRVPQGIPLSVGNVVHVPSIEPGAYGRVAYVENRPSQPEQFGYITLNKPLSAINYVAVGKVAVAPATPEKISDEVTALIKASVKINTAAIATSSNSLGTSTEIYE